MTTCDKNMLLQGGADLPPCFREADYEITVTIGDKTRTKPACATCAGIFRRRSGSKIDITITPLAVPGSAVRSISRKQRCESPSTRNATSAQAYTTCNAVLDGGDCPEAGDHVEL